LIQIQTDTKHLIFGRAFFKNRDNEREKREEKKKTPPEPNYNTAMYTCLTTV
jgi:hypothetical protein